MLSRRGFLGRAIGAGLVAAGVRLGLTPALPELPRPSNTESIMAALDAHMAALFEANPFQPQFIVTSPRGRDAIVESLELGLNRWAEDQPLADMDVVPPEDFYGVDVDEAAKWPA